MNQRVRVWIFYKKNDEHYKWNSKQLLIKLFEIKTNTNQMPIYHNKYKTTQHKIGERVPIDHNKHKTKVPP